MGKQVTGRKVGRTSKRRDRVAEGWKTIDDVASHRELFAKLDIGPSPRFHIHNAPGKPKGKS